MVDDYRTMNVVDKFNEIVKPVHYTRMNRDVTELTTITDDDIAGGRPFAEVCREFLKWSGNDIYMLEVMKHLDITAEDIKYSEVGVWAN